MGKWSTDLVGHKFNELHTNPIQVKAFFGLKCLNNVSDMYSIGPVFSIFILGIFGISWMKSTAFFPIGLTEFDICLPILEKKLLKCSAISALFSTISPLTLIFSIGWLVFWPVDASLMSSQPNPFRIFTVKLEIFSKKDFLTGPKHTVIDISIVSVSGRVFN